MHRSEASALAFSGRPDPRWPVSDAEAAELEALWCRLEPSPPGSPPPPLGYRGCTLRIAPDREYFAYRGVVTRTAAQASESRIDAAREFEKRVIATAPAGLLPPQLIDAF